MTLSGLSDLSVGCSCNSFIIGHLREAIAQHPIAAASLDGPLAARPGDSNSKCTGTPSARAAGDAVKHGVKGATEMIHSGCPSIFHSSPLKAESLPGNRLSMARVRTAPHLVVEHRSGRGPVRRLAGGIPKGPRRASTSYSNNLTALDR